MMLLGLKKSRIARIPARRARIPPSPLMIWDAQIFVADHNYMVVSNYFITVGRLEEQKNINAKYYENISKQRLNKNIFNKLNSKNNYILITANDLNTLIVVCNKTYNHNELKEYAINQKSYPPLPSNCTLGSEQKESVAA